MKASPFVLFALLSLTLCAPVLGHHSYATLYDATQPIELTGTVTAFEFRNPHSGISLEVLQADGSIREYDVELHPASALAQAGFTADTIRPGDRISVNAWPSRATDSLRVFAIGVLTADGRSLGVFTDSTDH